MNGLGKLCDTVWKTDGDGITQPIEKAGAQGRN